MSQHMRYGRGTVKVDLAEDGCRGILQPTLPPPIANPNEAITRCLDDPVGSKPLSQIVAGRRKVVVVIPDVTRGEAIQVYLPPLLRYLERHGAGRENVTILTATGAHRTHSDAEREALVGAEAAHGWTVADHDPDSGNDDLEPLDEATPFAVDKRAVESDCLILAGVVSYHYCAGFGGGRKLIAPGLCSRATVQALHRRTLANIDAEGRWRSRTGVLRGNPFHEILERAALRLKPAFALNVALSWDREILGVVAGDMVQSHQIACLQYDKMFRLAVRERLPLVVASCGGWPYDINLYQAHKAIDNAFRAVQPGGTIVLLAECAEGWGSESFVKWLTIGSLEERRARLESNFEVAGHTSYALKWKASQARVVIVSETLSQLAPAAAVPTGIETAADLTEAFATTESACSLPYYLMPFASCCLPEHTG